MITADSSEQVSGEFGAGRIKRRRREKRGAAPSRFSIFPKCLSPASLNTMTGGEKTPMDG